ncbi:MAG: response regulator [Sedimentisphaerales bacterium]|nr:response regulator [Sedimentisphaerales bacterium]
MENLKPVNILLVEDDPGDQKLIKSSMREQKMSNKLCIVSSGEEALEYLKKSKDGNAETPWPELILLDLNMPGMGGKEFLRRIKSSPDFNMIPVVILTTSDSEEDILESYKLQAAGYVRKPVLLDAFCSVAKDINEYWFTLCKRVSQRPLSCTKSR